jgi:hypothetical protein
VAAVIATLAALPAVGVGAPTSAPTRPAVSNAKGKLFLPALGDWEGSVNGFPASFRLRYAHTASGALRYGLDKLAVLRPASCAVSPSRYQEDLIDSVNPNPLGRSGSLGLGRFGFGGQLNGARSATLTKRYRVDSCMGTLSWHMHPAKRVAVQDGRWRIRYRNGASGTFRVEAGGRVAAGIDIPSAVTDCNRLGGQFDLFIGPNGQAGLSQPNLRASIRFTKRRGSGTVDGGGRSCDKGPLRFNVSR